MFVGVNFFGRILTNFGLINSVKITSLNWNTLISYANRYKYCSSPNHKVISEGAICENKILEKGKEGNQGQSKDPGFRGWKENQLLCHLLSFIPYKCHQFLSILYWSNSESWSQKRIQYGNIHFIKLDVYADKQSASNPSFISSQHKQGRRCNALASSPLTTLQNLNNTNGERT